MIPKLHLKDLASVTIQPAHVKEPPAPKAAEPAPACRGDRHATAITEAE